MENKLDEQISRLKFEIKLITESNQRKLKRRKELAEEIHRIDYELEIGTESIVKREKDVVELKKLQNKLNSKQ